MSNNETPRPQETPDDSRWQDFVKRVTREAREHGCIVVILDKYGRIRHSTVDDLPPTTDEDIHSNDTNED